MTEAARALTGPDPEQRLTFHVEDDPAGDDVARVDDALVAYTLRTTGQTDPKPLGVFARQGNTVVAGVHGWTWGRCCELVSLWVSEAQRRHGLGRELLAAAEYHAKERGCRQVVLFTHDNRTPRFYTSAGYEVVGRIDDYPEGSMAYWFRKRLDQPGVKFTRLVRATMSVGLALLLAAEIIDGIRSLSRRAGHLVAEGSERVERRERRNARRKGAIVVASWIDRPRVSPR